MNNKKIFYISLPFLLILSCSKDNEGKNSLIGQWQLVENCLSDGESLECTDIENGFIYHIKNDGTFR